MKKIIKGSSMMRHVSLSHRVALDPLFDGINLDPKMQINYIDNKHQLADILTKGNFRRDECNNLLRVFNIRNLSSVCCFETRCPISVSKRLQEGTGQKERVMAKSKPMTTVVSMTVGRSSTMPSSSASGILGAIRARNSSSSSQVARRGTCDRRVGYKTWRRALKRDNECMSKNWVCSWQWSSSEIHPQCSRLENSAKNTDISKSAPVVNYDILFKMAEAFASIRKTICRSLTWGCQRAPTARLQVRHQKSFSKDAYKPHLVRQ